MVGIESSWSQTGHAARAPILDLKCRYIAVSCPAIPDFLEFYCGDLLSLTYRNDSNDIQTQPHHNQPPVKPARCSPRKIIGLRRIVRQMKSSWAFANIARIGP